MEHRHGPSAGLRGTDGAELELVTGESEGRGTVAVRGVLRQGGQHIHTQLHGGLAGGGLGTAGLDLLHDVGQLVAEEDGDDGGRGLLGTEAVVVTGLGDGSAQQVRMQIDGADDTGQEGEEDEVAVRRLAGGEEGAELRGGEGPVIVLTGAVHTGVGLLVQQADQVELEGLALQDVHDHHIVVHGHVARLEERGDFELRGGHLVVAGLGRHTQGPEGVVHAGHELQHALLDGAEIVVLHLLMLGRQASEEGAARLNQVGALQIQVAVHQEVLLLRTQVAVHTGGGDAEALEHAGGLGAHRLHRAQQRGLLVQRLTGVGAERGRDAQGRRVGRALDERRGGGIPRRVAAGLEGGANAAGGEGRGIRLALDQRLTGELADHPALAVRLHKGVVLLCRGIAQRLEPVRVVRRSLGECPHLHGLCHLIRNPRVQLAALADGVHHLLERTLGEVLLHRLDAEGVAAVKGLQRFLRCCVPVCCHILVRFVFCGCLVLAVCTPLPCKCRAKFLKNL